MEVRIGDRVRFLNETGGGKVTKIIDTHFVEVMSDDGFEVPVLKRELIIVAGSAGEPRNTAPERAAQQAFKPARHALRADRSKESTGVYLVWLRPPASKVTGEADLHLVNHTPHDILFNILTGKLGEVKGFDYGSLAPGASMVVQQWTGNTADLLTEGIVQVLYHPLKPDAIRRPLTARFRLKAARLMNDEAYHSGPFFDQAGITVFLGYEGTSEDMPAAPQARREEISSPGFLDKYLRDDGQAVIDLHLESLVDNVKGISPAEALNIQLSFFERAMDAAATKGIGKLVFIHGVGNGILKAEIRKRLGGLENIVSYDAPLAQYGVGATEVRFPDNVH